MFKNKVLFALLQGLLICTLVIQPVTLAYSMANMGSHHQSTMPGTTGDSHGAIAGEDQHTSHHGHSFHTSADADLFADTQCCSTTVCGSAITDNTSIHSAVPRPDYLPAYQSRWQSIALSLEVKPPRLFAS